MTVRSDIRDAVDALLVAARTSAGTNIYQHRNLALEDALLPAINLQTLSETSSPLTMGMSSGLLERDLLLRIEGYYKSSATEGQSGEEDAILTALEDLAADIEVAMAADVTLGGKAKDSYLSSTEIESDADGSVANEVGVITLEYMVKYHTTRDTPATPI